MNKSFRRKESKRMCSEEIVVSIPSVQNMQKNEGYKDRKMRELKYQKRKRSNDMNTHVNVHRIFYKA